MRLDDQVFAEVIQALGAVAGPDEDPRRRKAERYHCVVDVAITPAGVANPTPRQVKLANISATGVCIIDQMSPANGNRFVVSLPRANGMMVNVLCTVRQSRLTGAGGFRTGAEFTGEAEVQQRMVSGVSGILAKVPGMEEETRIPARFAIRSGGAAGQLYQAFVREMSSGTVVLYTLVQVAPGTPLIIETNPGRPDRHVMQGVVEDVLTISNDQFRLLVRRETPAPPSKRPGLFGWLRKG